MAKVNDDGLKIDLTAENLEKIRLTADTPGSKLGWVALSEVRKTSLSIPKLNVILHRNFSMSGLSEPHLTVQHYIKGDEDFLKCNPKIALMREKNNIRHRMSENTAYSADDPNKSYGRGGSRQSKWTEVKASYDSGDYELLLDDVSRRGSFEMEVTNRRYCPSGDGLMHTAEQGMPGFLTVKNVAGPFLLTKTKNGVEYFKIAGNKRGGIEYAPGRTTAANFGLCVRIDNPAFPFEEAKEWDMHYNGIPRYLYGPISALKVSFTAQEDADLGYVWSVAPKK